MLIFHLVQSGEGPDDVPGPEKPRPLTKSMKEGKFYNEEEVNIS